jgi:hypothetical protein
MHPSDSDTLPDYETARKIVEMNALIERTTSPQDLARIAEATLQDADDFADDRTKRLMVDALFGEQNLDGRW